MTSLSATASWSGQFWQFRPVHATAHTDAHTHLREHVRQVLGTELALDCLKVPNGVHAVVNVHDALGLERAHDVDDGVDALNVRKERVSEARARARALDEASDVRHVEESGVLGGRLPELHERFIARVGYGDAGGRRVDLEVQAGHCSPRSDGESSRSRTQLKGTA